MNPKKWIPDISFIVNTFVFLVFLELKSCGVIHCGFFDILWPWAAISIGAIVAHCVNDAI